MTVRTAQLAAGTFYSGYSAVTMYTVPSDTTTIVKSIEVNPLDSGGTNYFIAVTVPGDGNGLRILAPTSSAVNVLDRWAGWLVLKPGDKLILFGGGNDFVVVSGTELAGVVP